MTLDCKSHTVKKHKHHKKYTVVEKNRVLLRLETVSFAFQFKEGGGVFGGDKTEFWGTILSPKHPQRNAGHDE